MIDRRDALFEALRAGDVLVATRLDRVGRSTSHLVALLDELARRGVAFRFLEQGIDTTTSEGRLMYRMLAAIAEFQRDLIVANTREGLAAARARGRRGGRKLKLTAGQVQLAQQLYDAKDKTVAEIAAIFNVPRTTLYGHLTNGSVGTRPRARKPNTVTTAPAGADMSPVWPVSAPDGKLAQQPVARARRCSPQPAPPAEPSPQTPRPDGGYAKTSPPSGSTSTAKTSASSATASHANLTLSHDHRMRFMRRRPIGHRATPRTLDRQMAGAPDVLAAHHDWRTQPEPRCGNHG